VYGLGFSSQKSDTTYPLQGFRVGVEGLGFSSQKPDTTYPLQGFRVEGLGFMV